MSFPCHVICYLRVWNKDCICAYLRRDSKSEFIMCLSSLPHKIIKISKWRFVFVVCFWFIATVHILYMKHKDVHTDKTQLRRDVYSLECTNKSEIPLFLESCWRSLRFGGEWCLNSRIHSQTVLWNGSVVDISISSPGFVKLRIRFNSTQSLRASLQLIRAVCVPNTRGLSRHACYRRQR